LQYQGSKSPVNTGTFFPPRTRFCTFPYFGKVFQSLEVYLLQRRLTDALPNNTCKLHTEWKKTNLLNIGSDLGACVGEGAVAGPAGGGAVGGVA
jgi:hypothetical protein